MAGNPRIQSAIENARSEIEIQHAVKQFVSDKLVNLAVVQRFVKAYVAAVQNGATSEEANEIAYADLPEDNPNTPQDEGMSREKFREIAEQAFEKPIEEVTGQDLDAIVGDLGLLRGKLILNIVQQMQIDSSIDTLDGEIRELALFAKQTASIGGA